MSETLPKHEMLQPVHGVDLNHAGAPVARVRPQAAPGARAISVQSAPGALRLPRLRWLQVIDDLEKLFYLAHESMAPRRASQTIAESLRKAGMHWLRRMKPASGWNYVPIGWSERNEPNRLHLSAGA